MNTLIISISIHHNNTQKIAEEFAKVLDCEIKKPFNVDPKDFEQYDLIGFGSGIYNGKHHSALFKLLDKLTDQNKKKAFIFSTCSIRVKSLHEELRKKLQEKGFEVIDEFQSRGFSDVSFIKYIGGINKGRPNEKDLQRAREFAEDLKK